jgi:cell division protein FtsL
MKGGANVYQYGNVAIQYQNEKKKRPEIRRQQSQQPKMAPARQGISPGEKLLYILFILIVVAVLSVLLTRYATISQLNYEAQYLEKESIKIEERNSTLQLEVASLSAPDRIIAIAQEEGMTLNKSTVKILSNPSTPLNAVEKTSVDE